MKLDTYTLTIQSTPNGPKLYITHTHSEGLKEDISRLKNLKQLAKDLNSDGWIVNLTKTAEVEETVEFK